MLREYGDGGSLLFNLRSLVKSNVVETPPFSYNEHFKAEDFVIQLFKAELAFSISESTQTLHPRRCNNAGSDRSPDPPSINARSADVHPFRFTVMLFNFSP